MSKAFVPSPETPAVITANDLRMGHCVWMTDDGWTDDPLAARLYEDKGHAELALLDAEAQGHIVVGPYIAQVKRGPRGPEPTHFREEFRRSGPTNYLGHDPAHDDVRPANDNSPATIRISEASHV